VFYATLMKIIFHSSLIILSLMFGGTSIWSAWEANWQKAAFFLSASWYCQWLMAYRKKFEDEAKRVKRDEVGPGLL
jgi:hypothetical protein